MINAPEPNKRLVSKRDYVSTMTKKVLLGTAGLFSIMIGLLLFASICRLLAHGRIDNRIALLAIAFCAWSSITGYFGMRLLQAAEKVEPGVPLTQANTADLSAPESLVRASQEPVHAQEAVLLRAAVEGQEQHEEQLLRAAAEGQD